MASQFHLLYTSPQSEPRALRELHFPRHTLRTFCASLNHRYVWISISRRSSRCPHSWRSSKRMTPGSSSSPPPLSRCTPPAEPLLQAWYQLGKWIVPVKGPKIEKVSSYPASWTDVEEHSKSPHEVWDKERKQKDRTLWRSSGKPLISDRQSLYVHLMRKQWHFCCL